MFIIIGRVDTWITVFGNLAIAATWIPKLLSHDPGCTWYKSVRLSSVVTAETCLLVIVGIVSWSLVNSWKWVANKVNALVSAAKRL